MMSREILFWGFSALALIGALVILLSSKSRKVGLGIWITGIGASGIFLSMNFELLAFFSGLICTAIAGVYIYFSYLFGDFEGRPSLRGFLLALCSGLLLGTFLFQGITPKAWDWSQVPQYTLQDLGNEILTHRILNMELIALTLLLSLMGVGILLRPQEKD